MASTHTHCPYCALNCGLALETEGGELTGQGRWKGSPLTGGALCAKGAAAWQQVRHRDRLRLPLVREGGRLVETDWETALDRVAEGFLRIREAHGVDANAVLSGGSLTNEKVYLMGKLARLALGTRHVDYNGRMCMVSAGAANTMAFGMDRAMTPLSEIERADVVVVVGANLSAAYPVVVPKALERVRRKGGRIIVIDPRAGRFVADEDLHLALAPATDAVLANGILREIARNGWVDEAFVRDRTVGFDDALDAAMAWTPTEVERVTGVHEDRIREAARLIGRADRVMYLHARGPEQQAAGTMNVLSLINVALARGHVGRPGCGIDMLTGQRNGQGGREWGQRCNQLPAGRDIESPEHRAEVAAAWGVDPAVLPGRGRTYIEILDMVERGEVRGLLSISTNMRVSAPDSGRVPATLDRLDHLVVIDPFLSESAEHATVVLPGSTFGEEDGTVTTIEGRVVRVDQAVPPLARRGDIDVIRNLARRLGAGEHFRFFTGAEVFEEMRAVSRGGPIDYSGITWDRLRDDGGVFWPCPAEDHPGTPQLYTERFAHPDGRARFHAVVPEAPPVVVDERHPLVLTTGRVLAHYLSRNQTRRIEAHERLAPAPILEVHPATAAALDLVEGQPVQVESRQGTIVLDWVANERIRPDTLFVPYHWEVVNRLTASLLDPISKIPAFKYTPVSVAPLGADVPVALSSSSTASARR
ncbi:molybdopterin oxidoreductase family protein [Actinomarinicola tropica]|uniref:molybdopterin oxidoreductase family protein n=1 Tax=Actinomarinicola tropica TaxID=2789776 RepID=UPI0018991315|nr:molybdopterin oxidoreductase family protein [Actinomarinicola tropica]